MKTLPQLSLLLFSLVVFESTACLFAQPRQAQIPNRLIDSHGFLNDIQESHALRPSRRLTEAQFIEMAKAPKTIILDARRVSSWLMI